MIFLNILRTLFLIFFASLTKTFDITNHLPYSYIFPIFFYIFQDHERDMFSVYRKISNMFQRSNHDQHDIMDHDHDHETPTGFIKMDHHIILIQEFAKKFIQIYKSMVNMLKQLKDIKRVNEVLKNEFHERKNHDRKRIFTPVFFNTTPQRTLKFPDPEKYGGAREKLESFKYAFRVKFRTNYDWYFTKDMKFDYAFLFEKRRSYADVI